MPSSSKKQHNFMVAIAHSPSFAKKVGVPQSVGKDFTKADKGRKFSKGGDMAAKKLFRGKETYSEELGEAKAVAAKKVSPRQFAKYEKAEGYKDEEKGAFGTGKKIASGRMTPAKYAEMEMKEPKEKFARGGGIESKGKTKGSMVKMSGSKRKFAEGGMTDADQEAADKAAGLEESNKEAPVGFLERLKAGNIDDPSSEAYKRFGAGRGAASRASRVPVEDAVPVKVDRTVPVERAMGEDERAAPTGMAAATVAAKPVVKSPVTTAAPARPAAPVVSSAPKNPVVPVVPAKPVADELADYSASKKKPPAKVEDLTAAEKRMFTPPTKEEIDKGMEVASQILGPGIGLGALRALAKKLASRGKSGQMMTTGRATGMRETQGSGSRSEAPYLKELGYEPRKIGSEPLKLGMKKGGNVKKMAKGGLTNHSSSASRRGDGIATKGKTRGRMV